MLFASRRTPSRLSPQWRGPDDSLGSPRPLLSHSPLSSPGLSSILPRHSKRRARPHTGRIVQWCAWLAACLLLFWMASRIVNTDQGLYTVSPASFNGQAYQIVEGGLPREPSPVVVSDQRGRSKWTVSIPPELDFPLSPDQYASICQASMPLSHRVAMEKAPQSDKNHPPAAHHPYYYIDPYFMDVADAESRHLLPGISLGRVELQSDHVSLGDSPRKQCDRSLTYALETSSAGLGQTLLSLWLAYGLAQSEKRAFFVDDTRWPYGSYGTYFQSIPIPDCLPPPKTQIVPCPHQARHLLVSAATVRYSFGHLFANEFEDPKEVGVLRQVKIFALMRTGYEALFLGKLNKQDQISVDGRLAELNTSIRVAGGEEIGVHVRRGDCHPLDYQYHKSYIPLEKYLNTAHDLSSHPNTRVLLASDDPDMYNSNTYPTINNVEKAQSAVSLASKTSVDALGHSGLGWQGGFFKDIFWSLGQPDRHLTRSIPSSAQSPSMSQQQQQQRRRQKEKKEEDEERQRPTQEPAPEDPKKHPSATALSLRELTGRAYLLDLAVLGQSDRVVCAVSAYGCRILAVMMGWEDAIIRQRWVNVDGSFDWRGVEW